MNRREFLKISCSGLITLYLSGCGLNMQSGPCVHKDDIETEAIQKFMEADVIALVSPVYYFALTAQLKTVIDRFLFAHLRYKRQTVGTVGCRRK